MSGQVKPASLVIGIGNEWRGDDAAGRLVVRRLREQVDPEIVEVLESSGDGASLLLAWNGFERVLLVDTVRSGAPPGTLLRLDLTREVLPFAFASSSTHLLGLADAVELARALQRLPAHLTFLGMEGSRFEIGSPISDGMTRSLDHFLTEILVWVANAN